MTRTLTLALTLALALTLLAGCQYRVALRQTQGKLWRCDRPHDETGW